MGDKNLEAKIDEEKTEAKLKAMESSYRPMVKEADEKIYRAKKGVVYIPGKCLPDEVQKVKTKDKVAIVGFAPCWDETPWDDSSFDIWGINELYIQVRSRYGGDKNFSAWFEIHNPFSPSRNIPSHHDWMKKWDKPILMQQHYDWIPNSIAIPRDNIVDYFNQNFVINDEGASFTDYSNQISVMTAMAIMMGYKEIHIYGVDMAQQSEYAWQRASCQFFIGYAAGMGVKVLIPIHSELCKYVGFYGFDTDNYGRMYMKKRIKTMKESIKQLHAQALADEYERKSQKQQNASGMQQFDLGLQRVDDELVKMDILVNKNKELLDFIAAMPTDPKAIDAKKTDVLKQIQEQNSAMGKSVKKLTEDKEKILRQKNDIARIEHMQETSYQNNRKQLELNVSGYQGIISDCRHNLDNNII